MRTEEEIAADAKDETPFSNMSMFEYWAAANCGRGNGCKHDSAWGGAPQEPEVWCPLITVSLGEKTLKEWQDADGETAAECKAYEETDGQETDDHESLAPEPAPVEPLPGQQGLF
jgi:hypothetical protein